MELLDVIAAILVIGLVLIAWTGLIGFLAIAGSFYLTHRTVELLPPVDSPVKSTFVDKVMGFIPTIPAPPPIRPDLSDADIALPPEVDDYIRAESEPWYQDWLRAKAKELYRQHQAWDWVLTELRKKNEQGAMELPDLLDEIPHLAVPVKQ